MIFDGHEELTEPGNWEKLRKELKPEEEKIVSKISDDEPINDSVKPIFTRLVPDPWS